MKPRAQKKKPRAQKKKLRHITALGVFLDKLPETTAENRSFFLCLKKGVNEAPRKKNKIATEHLELEQDNFCSIVLLLMHRWPGTPPCILWALKDHCGDIETLYLVGHH